MIVLFKIITVLIPALITAGFIIWCIRDIKRAKKEGKERCDKFDADLKAMVFKAQEENKKKIEQAILYANNRINLLSKENAKLMEENIVMREQLTNLGFKEPLI